MRRRRVLCPECFRLISVGHLVYGHPDTGVIRDHMHGHNLAGRCLGSGQRVDLASEVGND